MKVNPFQAIGFKCQPAPLHLGNVDTSHVASILPLATRANGERPTWTAHTVGASRDLVKQFLASIPNRCENCGAHNPKIIPEGSSKIYRHALAYKYFQTNIAMGVDIDAVRGGAG